jgi:hypothetical protein
MPAASLDTPSGATRSTSACLEDCADLGPDPDGEIPPSLERLQDNEPSIAALVEPFAGTAGHVLIVRAIDLHSGKTAFGAAPAIPDTPERHIHYADNHRVVVAGSWLLVCDARGEMVDHGPLSVPTHALSCVTRDASIVVIAAP